MIEQSLVIIKPDGVARGLMGEIISRFERKGFKVVGAKLAKVSEEKAKVHYEEHIERPFFPMLLEFITQSPVLLLVIEGNHAISTIRTLVGKTNGSEANPGTIRGDFGSSKSFNLIHASDSPESAQREKDNFFASEEILSYDLPTSDWLFAEGE
jgi:nucleoside-diphosphate kinase